MSTYASRVDLATILRGTGYQVHDHVPDSMEPPCLVIEPAEPYIEQREHVTFAEIKAGEVWDINLNVWIFLDYTEANEEATNAADNALLQVVQHLRAGGWEFTGAGKPGLKDYLNQIRVYGLRLGVTNTTTLT